MTLLSNRKYVEGENPTAVLVEAGIDNDAGLDGYITLSGQP